MSIASSLATGIAVSSRDSDRKGRIQGYHTVAIKVRVISSSI